MLNLCKNCNDLVTHSMLIMEKSELLTPREAAKELKVCRHTVYNLLKSGDLKGRKIGGLWRIPSDAIFDRPKASRQPA